VLAFIPLILSPVPHYSIIPPLAFSTAHRRPHLLPRNGRRLYLAPAPQRQAMRVYRGVIGGVGAAGGYVCPGEKRRLQTAETA